MFFINNMTNVNKKESLHIDKRSKTKVLGPVSKVCKLAENCVPKHEAQGCISDVIPKQLYVYFSYEFDKLLQKEQIVGFSISEEKIFEESILIPTPWLFPDMWEINRLRDKFIPAIALRINCGSIKESFLLSTQIEAEIKALYSSEKHINDIEEDWIIIFVDDVIRHFDIENKNCYQTPEIEKFVLNWKNQFENDSDDES